MFRFLVEHPEVTGSLSLRVLSAATPAEAVRCLAPALPTALPAYCKHRGTGTALPQMCATTKEMENISRGSTFGDFVTNRIQVQSTRVQTPLSILF
jgi:hypothetical protein